MRLKWYLMTFDYIFSVLMLITEVIIYTNRTVRLSIVTVVTRRQHEIYLRLLTEMAAHNEILDIKNRKETSISLSRNVHLYKSEKIQHHLIVGQMRDTDKELTFCFVSLHHEYPYMNHHNSHQGQST